MATSYAFVYGRTPPRIQHYYRSKVCGLVRAAVIMLATVRMCVCARVHACVREGRGLYTKPVGLLFPSKAGPRRGAWPPGPP